MHTQIHTLIAEAAEQAQEPFDWNVRSRESNQSPPNY